MEISGPRIGLRAMQLETVLAHVSQQLITCGRVRKHLTVRPEVGAVCEKDACPDLCGGREVTCVPTATAWHNAGVCNVPSWRRAHATVVPITPTSFVVCCATAAWARRHDRPFVCSTIVPGAFAHPTQRPCTYRSTTRGGRTLTRPDKPAPTRTQQPPSSAPVPKIAKLGYPTKHRFEAVVALIIHGCWESMNNVTQVLIGVCGYHHKRGARRCGGARSLRHIRPQ